MYLIQNLTEKKTKFLSDKQEENVNVGLFSAVDEKMPCVCVCDSVCAVIIKGYVGSLTFN